VQVQQLFSPPYRGYTFSEILISAVKSTFSHSNHHKSIKELLWISFLKSCFSPYRSHRSAEAIFGQIVKISTNEQYLRICLEL